MTDKPLAKSNPARSLEQHLLDTEQAGRAIFCDRILDNWRKFFKFSDSEQFLRLLAVAALAHDLGKANDEFQAMLEGSKNPQALRHEWISAWILHWLRPWLSRSPLLDFEIVTAAVLGHHLTVDINPNEGKYWLQTRTTVTKLPLDLGSDQVQAILWRIANRLELTEFLIPALPDFWDINNMAWQRIREDAAKTAKSSFKSVVRTHSDRRALHLAVKAGVIVADTAASGIVREEGRLGKNILLWIAEHLHKPALTPEQIDRDILDPRYRKIEQKTGQPFQLLDFQIGAERLGDRALLLAGCGQGKTLAAYLWAKGVTRRRQIGRILFLYPTRATATEGFKDYTAAAPETDAGLLHGTSAYELEKYELDQLEDVPDDPHTGSNVRQKNFQPDPRLFALGLWGKRYFSATVDRFLSFLVFNYESTVLLPLLVDSAIVLDEIHAYDRKMFHLVLAFLKAFDVPVLCMTATLPESRRKQLEKLGLELYPNNPDAVAELKREEERPRYRITESDRETAKQLAHTAYAAGKRILWVVNTVDRCQKLARELSAMCYHSRFKLADRQKRHEEVVAAFKRDKNQCILPQIAVTTQVCEMSLDLDADVLITELAPCSALVQRFGRSNRHGYLNSSEIFVYEPDKELPYTKEELDKARKFLSAIIGEDRSQSFLSEQLEIHGEEEVKGDGNAPFLTGGYYANGEPFRDIENWTRDCILDGDDGDLSRVEEIHAANLVALKEGKPKQSWDGFVVSVPNKLATPISERKPETKLPSYLGVANSTLYSEAFGFEEP